MSINYAIHVHEFPFRLGGQVYSGSDYSTSDFSRITQKLHAIRKATRATANQQCLNFWVQGRYHSTAKRSRLYPDGNNSIFKILSGWCVFPEPVINCKISIELDSVEAHFICQMRTANEIVEGVLRIYIRHYILFCDDKQNNVQPVS